jgi:hypothetical protein
MRDRTELPGVNLTAAQKDYAIFLPAISSFYATYIGRQRHSNYVPASRMPQCITQMEQLNWLNPKQALFPYRWSLYSAGHANLDLKKSVPREDMVRNRDPGSVLIADSGGFQIAKGVWPGRWADPRCANAEKKRRAVLEWQCGIADLGMTMDIPTWTHTNPEWAAAAGIYSYEDAVRATQYNNEYWIANRHGSTRMLNVLQGASHSEADHWYDIMKGYSDPQKYPDRHFNGWGMGGQNMCDIHLILRRLVMLIHDGLLQQGVHDWMHFLGTSRLEWAVLLTAIQRAVREHANPDFTISFDCASPFLATANGQLYHDISTPDRGKWSYLMSATADHKRYATDTRPFGDAVIQDGIHPRFSNSPVTHRLQIRDVCVYRDGVRKTDQELGSTPFDFANPDHYHVLPDLNKNGRIGRTSWDSFSYALLMAHNVYMHIEAVQRANREFDSGSMPGMLAHPRDSYYHAASVIHRVFAARDRSKSLQIIDDHARIWQRVIGTRGYTGSRAVNSRTTFNELFDLENTVTETLEFDPELLERLEDGIDE